MASMPIAISRAGASSSSSWESRAIVRAEMKWAKKRRLAANRLDFKLFKASLPVKANRAATEFIARGHARPYQLHSNARSHATFLYTLHSFLCVYARRLAS